MAGRPRIYNSVDELSDKCEEYFANTSEEGTKPTISGLAIYLGFADKTTLYEYRDRPEFSYPVKKAISTIEMYHEENLFSGSVAGSIFALKNMGWKDKVEQDIKHSGGVTMIFEDAEYPNKENESI